MVKVRLVARLTDSGGRPLSGRHVHFYYDKDGDWQHIDTAITNDDGYAVATHETDRRTVYRAEFKGDDLYEPSSATAVWEPSGRQVEQQGQCRPVIKTGIGVLDAVLFCVGGYGVTVLVLVVAALILLMLLRSK